MAEGTLSYLYALAEGDMGFVVEILDLMYKNIPLDIANIEQAISRSDFTNLKRSAHHMKSSIQYSNDIDLSDLLAKIETTKDSIFALNEVKSLMPQLKELSDKLMQLIETEKKKIV
jgi:hypothetical protein